ncbi:MAG: ABC transporter permease [Solirubrobacteraceae bacterium]|nr:ABC transporter permease [Patulibacter sp.]
MSREGMRRLRLIAAREFRDRVGQKAYRLAIVFGMILAAAAVVLPSVLGGGDDGGSGPSSSGTVVVAYGAEGAAAALTVDELRRAGDGVRGGRIHFVAGASADAARAEVRKGDRDLALVVGGSKARPSVTLVSRQDGGGELADQAAAVVDRAASIARLASSGAAGQQALAPASITPEIVAGSGPTDRAAGVVGVLGLLLYVGGLLLATAYGNGVVSDRTNHVTERLLTAAKPFEHLAGKLLGIGASGLLQFALWMIAAVAANAAAGHGSAFDGVPLRLLVFFPVALVLTYLLYASLAAILVLPVRKSEDVGPALAPATILQIVSFSFGTTIVAPGSTVSSLVHTMSLIPFFSPILMLCRLAGEAVPAGELAVGILGPIVVSAILLRLVAPAYARYAIDAPGGKGLGAVVAMLRR